ncbi:ABC transporter ATP-binding protein [Salipaludibacillus sp. LMS25]|jgi:ABC-2 type transport system ATP-binding protein|uniref:ABC transporter ATP-binding protein n=1 Tax=Salipaludibacillus sp. LMS25 TaxID=2924031 RepID=UPI0020D01D27|nr:ABC transporter ATP-binding protein [Salipaludibacillus sp. LMS25]UTR15809.1 ABC transporter ATP-binding protein [Salipaludibacillus sp. LMS25]
MCLIETKNLTKKFRDHKAVKNVSLTIREGVCTALLGPNGAGKTTTLNLLTGLIKPSNGHISFHQAYPGDRRKFIGYLPQSPQFYNWMSGIEYTIFAAELAGMNRPLAKEKAHEVLTLVGLLEAKNKKIAGYSGGMKQRLGIAQALVHEPKLIILDEPVSALDPIGRRDVLELMRRLKSQTSILFSTHVLHDAEEISDDIYIMKKGEVVIGGSLKELKKNHQQSIIFIETEKNNDSWVQKVKGHPWVEDVKYHKGTITLEVKSLNQAREWLLHDQDLHDLNIERFEVAKTSLEDLFMKVAIR